MADEARTPGSLKSQGAEIFVERLLIHKLTSATTFDCGRAAEEAEVSGEESCLDSGDSRGAAALLRFEAKMVDGRFYVTLFDLKCDENTNLCLYFVCWLVCVEGRRQ